MTRPSPLQRRRRPGFTLVESIVTVGLIAVLAAFVVPTVIQKASAADPVKIANDLGAVRTAMEGFANDIKAGFPNQIYVLTAPPVAGTNKNIDSVTVFTAGQVVFWNGPYIATTITNVALDSIATGFTAYIQNVIQRYDVANNAPELDARLGTTFGGAFNANNTLFAVLKVTGLTQQQAALINRLIDGANDTAIVGGADEGANNTGRFRYTIPTGGVVRAYFFAAPIT